MKLLILVILCVLINVLSRYIIKFIEELRNIKKAKDSVNKIDFNKLMENLDKDLYSDFNNDDIEKEK